MLKSFLNKKTLFYNKIDYAVISEAWNILSDFVNLPFVIHIVGTNGKGSTGRFLAHILSQNGYKTLHYSSPHIINFNERIWINGNDCSNKELDKTHKKLLKILPKNIIDKLTYFEYTTLLALLLSNNLDYIVLEAGLGGEFDATNVVKNDLTLITTIGLDHTEFLGNTIQKIAKTKMRSCNKTFILGKQIYKKEVLKAKNKVLNQKNEIRLSKFSNSLNINLPKYLKDNLDLALSAIVFLKTKNKKLKIKNLKLPTVFGRCQKIAKNITIDVGHNPLAAKVLYNEFNGQKIILIYNSYKDKDIKLVLKILKPIIKEVQIISINDKRIINTNNLISICNDLDISVKKFGKIKEKNKYLVFGSFKVVEEFLKREKIEK